MSTENIGKNKRSLIKQDAYVTPSDMIYIILIKVCAATLLRFKSVSQSWSALISDVIFTKAHRDESKALGREKLLLQGKTGEFEFIHLNDLSGVIVKKQQSPLKGFPGAHVLCSYDGLVLLKKPKAYKKFVLWNPSSGEHRNLECSYMEPHEHTFPRAYGLCYDSTTDDYKVILIYSLFYVVYSMSRDSWTKKTAPLVLQQCLPEFEHLPDSRSYVCSQGVGIENRVYWSLNQKLDPYKCKTFEVIYFDAKSDELKEFPKPTSTAVHDHLFRLATLKGRLSTYGGNNYFNGLNIWIMKQDGWSFLTSIRSIPALSCARFFSNYKLLCGTENDELIIQGPNHHNLSIYCPKQRQFVRTTNIPNHLQYVFSPVDPICLDSLYFPRLAVTHKRKQRSTPSESRPDV